MKIIPDWPVRRLLLLFAVLGLAIRLALAPFESHPYDLSTWATIVENIYAGNELYDVWGYFYTPVWGYILNVVAVFMELLLDPGSLSASPAEALVLFSTGYSGSVSTPYFNLVVKIPLALVDLCIAYCLFLLVKRLADDERKAVFAFAVWMLIPPAIITVGIRGMFDNIAALFLLMSLLFLFNRRYMFAGTALALSLMTKFFPGLAILAMVPYIWKTSEAERKVKDLASFLGGFIVTNLLVILPQIVNHQLYETFHFIIFRLNGNGGSAITTMGWAIILGGMIAVIVISLLTILIYRRSLDHGKTLVVLCTLITGTVILFMFNQQYLVQALPLFVLAMVVYGYRFREGLVVVSMAYIVTVLINTPPLLLPFAYYSDMISFEWAMDSYLHLRDQTWYTFLDGNLNLLIEGAIALADLYLLAKLLSVKKMGS